VEDDLRRRAVEEVQADGVAAAEGVGATAAGAAAGVRQGGLAPRDGVEREPDEDRTSRRADIVISLFARPSE
jgi:hypothetical protein